MFHRLTQTSYWFVILGFTAAIGCDQGDKPTAGSGATPSLRPVEQESPGREAKNNGIVFEGFVVHTPVVHENLTIFPVSLVEPNLEDRFITLDEGLKNGTIEVFELSAGNTDADGNQGALPPIPLDDPFDGSPAVQDNGLQPGLEPFGADPDPVNEAAPTVSDDFVPDDEPVTENLSTENRTLTTENAADDLNQEPADMEPQQSLTGQGNSVNRVYVRNRSDRPLYLMPGEIILGGDQDRTIGEEIVIAPSEEPVEVEVFCVEHGRWEGRSAERTIQELAAAVANPASAQSIGAKLSTGDEGGNASLDESARELSQQAENGQFIASVGVLTKGARLAAQGSKDQDKVWAEVASANASASSQIASGAFTQNYVQEDNIKRFESFVEALQDKVDGTENIVGVVVAVNGEIDAADIFESTPLFRKLWPKLLKSYSLDAANRTDDPGTSEDVIALEPDITPAAENMPTDTQTQLVTCTMQDAIDFLQKAKSANETASDVKDGMEVSHRSDDSVDSFSLRMNDPTNAAAGSGGFGGGGLGGAVHFSGFSK